MKLKVLVVQNVAKFHTALQIHRLLLFCLIPTINDTYAADPSNNSSVPSVGICVLEELTGDSGVVTCFGGVFTVLDVAPACGVYS